LLGLDAGLLRLNARPFGFLASLGLGFSIRAGVRSNCSERFSRKQLSKSCGRARS